MLDPDRLDRLLSSLQQLDHASSALQRICVVCVDVTEMAGAGVSRITAGRHETLEATNPLAAEIERLQIVLAEGPCREVVASYKPSLEPDLSSPRAALRWPRFTPAALERGVAAAFAFPLITDGAAIGALDVYSDRPGAMRPERVEDSLILAGLAGLALERVNQPSSVAGVDLNAEPAEDWAYSAIVHNASGMVSEQLGIGVDEALIRLRAIAFATDRRVADVARHVVDRKLRLDAWSDHE